MRRKIEELLKSVPTSEGAGVRLQRAFGYYEATMFDPFLMLDDFRSDNPEDYIKGFTWHPHRGIETITYVLCGDVEHGDSMGTKDVISSGDVQWMTAGSGIIHQEMPKGDEKGSMQGFQLWANLPSDRKMIDPVYRSIKDSEVPRVTLGSGVEIKIIAGEVAGKTGPVRGVAIDPEYLDCTLPAGTEYVHPTRPGRTAFIYVIGGSGVVEGERVENLNLVLFGVGDELAVRAGSEGTRFLLVTGRPLNEPIAWKGPIVMNTPEELDKAFEEYRNGTFVRHG